MQHFQSLLEQKSEVKFLSKKQSWIQDLNKVNSEKVFQDQKIFHQQSTISLPQCNKQVVKPVKKPKVKRMHAKCQTSNTLYADFRWVCQKLDSWVEKDVDESKKVFDFMTFIARMQCPICMQNYNTNKKRPMKICMTSSLHQICKECFETQKSIHDQPKCCICRSCIVPSEVVQNDELVNWLYATQKLGISIPRQYAKFPKEIHQSIRKMEIHHFHYLSVLKQMKTLENLKLQIKKAKEQLNQGKKNQKLMINHWQQIVNHKSELCYELDRQIKNLQIQKDKLYKQTENIRNEGFVHFKPTQLPLLEKLARQAQNLFSSIQQSNAQLITLYKSTFDPHLIQKHSSKPIHLKDITKSLSTKLNGRIEPESFFNDCFSDCAECSKLFDSIEMSKVWNLEMRRNKAIEGLHILFRANAWAFVKGFVCFVPHRIDPLKLQDEVMLEEIKLYEKQASTKNIHLLKPI